MSNKVLKRTAGNITALPAAGKQGKRPEARNAVSQNGSAEKEKVTALARCEVTIEKGVNTAIEVAAAIFEIRRDELCKPSYTSFPAYCKGRWNFSRQQGHRWADMGELNEQFAPTGNVVPSEYVARMIKRVPKEQRQTVMERAKEIANGKRVEGKHYEEAINEISPATPSTGTAKAEVVRLPTLQDAISMAQIRAWNRQARSHVENDVKKNETLDLLDQIDSALSIIDNTDAQKVA